MSYICDENGQLELPLFLSSDPYFLFRSRISNILLNYASPEALCYELRDCSTVHSFPVTASWTRRFLREATPEKTAFLLECFGTVFQGHEVGHIGRDLLIKPLHSEHPEIRAASINVLVQWLDDEPSGIWWDMAADLLDQNAPHEGMTEEERELWDALLFYQEEGDNEKGDEEDVPQVDEEANPLLEEFFSIRHASACELQGTFPLLRVGPVLGKITGLPDSLMSGIIELLQMPVEAEMTNPLQKHPAAQTLGVYWSGSPGNHRCLYVWELEGAFAFTLKPTDNRWHLSCHLR